MRVSREVGRSRRLHELSFPPPGLPRSAEPREGQPLPNLQEPQGQPLHTEGTALPRHGGAPRLLHRALEGHPEPLAAALQPRGAYAHGTAKLPEMSRVEKRKGKFGKNRSNLFVYLGCELY